MDERANDVIVIGSGFGGAVSACRLAQAGFDVTLLERGRRFEQDDFPVLPNHPSTIPDFKRYSWQLDHGIWDVADLDELISVQAAGYGGGSLLYANVHLRPPAGVFDAQWPVAYRDERALAPFYDLAASMLGAQPLDEDVAATFPKVAQLKDSAAQLHRARDFFLPPLTINLPKARSASKGSKRVPTLDVDGNERPDCEYCGKCSTGCPVGAKNTLDRNYLAWAEKYGTRVQTLCEVVELERTSAGFVVRYVDHLLGHSPGELSQLSASYVFVCAGAIHSTRLLHTLKGKGVKELRKEAVGPGLAGIGYFPNADALGVVYDTKKELLPARGPTIGGSLVHWNDQTTPPGSRDPSPPDFFLLQDGGYGSELSSVLGLLRAGVWLQRNRVTRGAGISPVQRMAELIGPTFAALVLPSVVDAASAGVRGWWQAAWREQTNEMIERGLRRNGLDDVVSQSVDSVLPGPLGRLAQWLLIRNPERLAARAAQFTADKALQLGGALLKSAAAFDAIRGDQRLLLLAMGRDKTSGVLHYDRPSGQLRADLDLYHLTPLYQQEEALMALVAGHTGGELRVNPAQAFLGKPITVHGQGGCRMSDSPADGVTTPDGEVHGVPGLFVLDGSSLCTSVGVNPSATIAAIAERNILTFIRARRGQTWGTSAALKGGEGSYAQHVAAAATWAAKAKAARWALTPPAKQGTSKLAPRQTELGFEEFLRGVVSEDLTLEDHRLAKSLEAPRGHAPAAANHGRESVRTLKQEVVTRFRELERTGKTFVELSLRAKVADLATFMEDQEHRIEIDGTIGLSPTDGRAGREGTIVGGYLALFVPRYKPQALEKREERAAQVRAAGSYQSVSRPPLAAARRPEELARYMDYTLPFVMDGERWMLRGRKKIRSDPGFDLWDDTSTLFVTVQREGESPSEPGPLLACGVVRLGPLGFARHQALKMVVKQKGAGAEDSFMNEAWARATFGAFFLGRLQRIYTPKFSAVFDTFFRFGRGTP